MDTSDVLRLDLFSLNQWSKYNDLDPPVCSVVTFWCFFFRELSIISRSLWLWLLRLSQKACQLSSQLVWPLVSAPPHFLTPHIQTQPLSAPPLVLAPHILTQPLSAPPHVLAPHIQTQPLSAPPHVLAPHIQTQPLSAPPHVLAPHIQTQSLSAPPHVLAPATQCSSPCSCPSYSDTATQTLDLLTSKHQPSNLPISLLSSIMMFSALNTSGPLVCFY